MLARGVQGLGAALVSPAALSLVMTLFREGSERNKALGVWGAVAGSGGAAGVILGGVLTEWLGWQAVLYVNVPIGIVAALLATRLLPEGRERPARARSTWPVRCRSRPAWRCSSTRWSTPTTPAGGRRRRSAWAPSRWCCSRSFVVIELARDARWCRSASSPIGRCAGRTSSAIAMTMAMFPMFFFLTFYTQQVLGYSADRGRLRAAPDRALDHRVGGLASQLVTRVGYKTDHGRRPGGRCVGLLWFAQISPDGSFLADLLGPSLFGFGVAFAFVATTIAATTGVSGEQAGLASGPDEHVAADRRGARPGDPGRGRNRAYRRRRPGPDRRADRGLPGGLHGGALLALLGAVLALVLLSSGESRAHAAAARQRVRGASALACSRLTPRRSPRNPPTGGIEAGLEHLSRGTARHVETLFVVGEPYFKSLETASRSFALAKDLGHRQCANDRQQGAFGARRRDRA